MRVVTAVTAIKKRKRKRKTKKRKKRRRRVRRLPNRQVQRRSKLKNKKGPDTKRFKGCLGMFMKSIS